MNQPFVFWGDTLHWKLNKSPPKALHMTPCKPPTRPLKTWRLLGPNQKFLRWNGCFGHVPTSVKHPKDSFKVKELVTHTCCSQGNKRLNGGWKLFLPSCKHYLILSLDLWFLTKKIGLIGLQDSNPPERKCSTISTVKFHLTQPSSNPTLKKKTTDNPEKTHKGGRGGASKQPHPAHKTVLLGPGWWCRRMRWRVQGEVRLFQRPDVSMNRLPTCFFAKCDCLSGGFNDVFIHVVLVHIPKKVISYVHIHM